MEFFNYSNSSDTTVASTKGVWELENGFPVVVFTSLLNVTIFMVLGTCGNILIILSVITQKQLRNVGNVLILNLAVADLGVSGIAGPFNVVGILKGKRFFDISKPLCDIVSSICTITCVASITTISLISVNRMIYITKPRQVYDKFYNKKTIGIIVLFVWLHGALWDLPNFPQFSLGGRGFDEKLLLCLWNRDVYPHYGYLFGAAVFFWVIIALVCYVKIFHFVARTRANMENIKSYQDTISLAKTLFSIYIVYLVCWAPFSFLILADPGNNWSEVAYIIGVQFAHTNSSLNSIIYGWKNHQFRSAYKNVLRSIFCCQKLMVNKTATVNTAGSVRVAIPSRLGENKTTKLANRTYLNVQADRSEANSEIPSKDPPPAE